MSTEDDLRAALQREAQSFKAPSGLWTRIAESIDRRAEGGGRRAAWIAIVVGGVLIAAAAMTIAARDTEQSASTTTTSDAGEASTSTTGPDEPMPARLIAARTDGDIVVVDTADNATLIVLYDHTTCPDCGPPSGLSLAPGGATLFFHLTEDGVSRLKRVAVAGGAPSTVADGCLPTPSPDGRRLAWVACGRGEDVVVRDLSTGRDARIPRGAGRETFTTQGLAWSADGSSIYMSAGPADGTIQLWQLDVATAKAQADSRLIGPPSRAPEGTQWSHPHARDSKLAVVESCCGSGPAAFDGAATLVVLDVGAARELARTPLDGDEPPLSVAYDQSGSHTLVVTADGDLFRRSGDGDLRRVGGGFRHAVWS